MVTTSNFHISQTFSCISKFFSAIYSLFYWFKMSLYRYMNVIVTDIISYEDVMVDVAIATLQSTHFIYQFEVFFAANSLINLQITQL